MNQENIAKVYGKDLPISLKQSVEVCKFIKRKELGKAKEMLESVIKKKMAVPYTRYKRSMPHRSGRMATGRYPIKVCQNILLLLKSAEANASNKGLDKNNLIVKTLMPNTAARPMHPGRHRGRKMKRVNIYIELEEKAGKKKKETKAVEEKATPVKEEGKK